MRTSVERLARRIEPRSAEIEELRRLPADVVEALVGTGVFRSLVPAELGGGETSLGELVEALTTLSEADGSVGWCAMIGATTGLLAWWLPEEHRRAVFGAPRDIAGGFAAPMGRATAVEGGVRVTGRWQWGSGTSHCTWIGGGCLLMEGEAVVGAPFVLFPADDVTIVDTWHVSGLKGTASNDYEVRDVFVPAGRWATPVAEPVLDAPLSRLPFFGALAAGVSAVALGLGRRAVRELAELAVSRNPQGSRRTLAERGATQSELAAAEAEVASSECFLASAVEEVTRLAERDAVSVEARRRLRLAASHATLAAARAVDRCYTAGGGSAVYTTSPLQRVFRDVHVATQHAMVAPRTLELTGRLRLGLPTDTAQL